MSRAISWNGREPIAVHRATMLPTLAGAASIVGLLAGLGQATAALGVDTPASRLWMAAGCVVVAALGIARAWLTRVAQRIEVHERSVFHVAGIVANKRETAMIPQIAAIEVEQGIAGRIFGYGTIRIDTTGVERIEMVGVNDPDALRILIESLIEAQVPAKP